MVVAALFVSLARQIGGVWSPLTPAHAFRKRVEQFRRTSARRGSSDRTFCLVPPARSGTMMSALLPTCNETIQSPCSRPTREYDEDSLHIFRKFLHSSDLETPMRKQEGGKEDIGIDSIAAETNQTHTIVAHSFLRLTSLDSQIIERLDRYETTLWRQTAQILLLLSAIEFRGNDRLSDERPQFARLRRKHGRYPPFDFNSVLRSAGRWR